MKYATLIIGILLLLAGGTFFLQGINVLPGSRMTGDPFWAWVGLIMLIIGGVTIFVGLRGKRVA